MEETSNAAESNAAKWPESLEHTFIVTLIEETGKGKVHNGKVKTDCWKAVTDEFNKKAGKHYNVEQIKGKLKRLKKKYRLFSKLIARTDMEWDPNTNTAKGSDAAWLNALQVSVIPLINFHFVHYLNSSCKQSRIYQCL